MSWQITLRQLDEATKGAARGDLVYVPDDLYRMYESGLKRQTRFQATAHPKPNLLFRAVVIRPKSLEAL